MTSPNIPKHNGNPLTAVWYYSPTIAAARYDSPDGSKSVVPYTLNGSQWTAGAPPEPRPLFGLDSLKLPPKGKTDPNYHPEPVLIVEGEKCAAALHQLGFQAVTSMGGSTAAHKSDWTALNWFECIILPDNDEPGKKYAAAVADRLNQSPSLLTTGATVRPDPVKVLRLDLPEGGDIVDWIQARFGDWDGYSKLDGADAVELGDELRAMLDSAVPLEAADTPSPAADDWPEPEPLAELPGVPAFPVHALPDAVQGRAVCVARRINVPVDFTAAAALVGAGSLIGRRTLADCPIAGYREAGNLWGMLVGHPGCGKTPAMKKMLAPVQQLEDQAFDRWKAARAEFQKKYREWEALRTEITRKAAREEAKGDAESADDTRARLTPEPTPPQSVQFIVSDSTPEALMDCMEANPFGLLMFRDELMGLLKQADKSGFEDSKSLYLESHPGTGSAQINRKGAGRRRVKHAVLSIIGGIPPEPLQSLILKGDDDGFRARFGLAVWPDELPFQSVRDRTKHPADRDAAELYESAMMRLATEGVPQAPGAVFDDALGTYTVGFQPDAAELYIDIVDRLEARRLREENQTMKGWLSKAVGLFVRLALVRHCLDMRPGDIEAESVRRAAALVDCLEAHARRIHSVGSPEQALAHKILRVLPEAVDEHGRTTRRDLQRLALNGGKTTPEFDAALDMLEAHGHIRWDRANTRGGTRVYQINPSLSQRQDAA